MANIEPWLKALNFNEIQKDNLFELEINSHKIEINIGEEKENLLPKFKRNRKRYYY